MPKTKAQNQKIKEERYQQIIKTCVDLFAFNGYRQITIDTITKKAKCSHGLFYHYFKNKEDAFNGMMKTLIFEFEEALKDINLENNSAQEAINNFIDFLIAILNNPDSYYSSSLYLLLNVHLDKDTPKPNNKKNVNDIPLKRRPFYFITLFLVTKGQEEGVVFNNKPEEITIAFLSLIKGLIYNRFLVGKKKFICPKKEVLVHLLLK